MENNDLLKHSVLLNKNVGSTVNKITIRTWSTLSKRSARYACAYLVNVHCSTFIYLNDITDNFHIFSLSISWSRLIWSVHTISVNWHGKMLVFFKFYLNSNCIPNRPGEKESETGCKPLRGFRCSHDGRSAKFLKKQTNFAFGSYLRIELVCNWRSLY